MIMNTITLIIIMIIIYNDLILDPFGLRDKICGDNDGRKTLVQSLEMINGRVAMLATVGFAIQEAYTGNFCQL